MQRPASFAAWADATPNDFVFALKGPRFITHMLKLNRAKTPLANFFASGVCRLGSKLGPVLWQLPPNFAFHREKLERFLEQLPRDTDAAAELAHHHDQKLKGRAWLKSGPNRKLRYAMEIRHETFRSAEFIRVLRRYGVALVCADSVEWPLITDVPADFCYCRLHGSEILYASGYDEPALRAWSRRIAGWASGATVDDRRTLIDKPLADGRKRDVFVYFDNDAKVRAPFDAQVLRSKLDRALRVRPPESLSAR